MVMTERLSEEPNAPVIDEDVDTDDWPDDASTATSQDHDACSKDGCLDIVTSGESCPGTFGNIVVKNSADVHFGNKTFYQGPVTIKQFLYNNGTSDSQLSIEHCKNDSDYVTDGAPVPAGFCINGDGVSTNEGKNHIVDNFSSQIDKDENWLKNTLRHHKILLLCVCVLISIFVILLSTLLATKHLNNFTSSSDGKHTGDSPEQENNTPVEYPTDPEVNLTLSGKLRIISRLEWLAQPPTNVTPLHLPVPYVVILHTATESCSDQATCTFHMRFLQTFHIESRKWWDIAYSFLVGGDGYAYEGRGWKNEGAFTYGYNSKAIGIAFIGTFNDILPPARQILAAQQLIAKGVQENYIAKDYKLLAHRQLSATLSPGEKLYENIKTWPHWSKSPN